MGRGALMRRTLVGSVVVALGALPTAQAAAVAMSQPAVAPASGQVQGFAVEQTGPFELTITNAGAADAAFPGAWLRRAARSLKLDRESSCLAVNGLPAGGSCVVRLQVASEESDLRLIDSEASTIRLANMGEETVRLRSRKTRAALRLLGMRSGTCLTVAAIAPGRSCTLRVDAPADPVARTLGHGDLRAGGLTTFATPDEQYRTALSRAFASLVGSVSSSCNGLPYIEGLVCFGLLYVFVGLPIQAVCLLLSGDAACGYRPPASGA